MWRSAPEYGSDWRRYFSNSRFFEDVTDNYTADAIARVYRKRALKYHPDKNPNGAANAERAFKQLGKYKNLANREFARASPPSTAASAAAAAAASVASLAPLARAAALAVEAMLTPGLSPEQRMDRLKKEGFVFPLNDPRKGRWASSNRIFILSFGTSGILLSWWKAPTIVTMSLSFKGTIQITGGSTPGDTHTRAVMETLLDAYAAAKARIPKMQARPPPQQPRPPPQQPRSAAYEGYFSLQKHDGDKRASTVSVYVRRRDNALHYELTSTVSLGAAPVSDREQTLKLFRKALQMDRKLTYFVEDAHPGAMRQPPARVGTPGQTWGKSRSMASATEFFDAIIAAVSRQSPELASMLTTERPRRAV